jgi:hypothetical protein
VAPACVAYVMLARASLVDQSLRVV